MSPLRALWSLVLGAAALGVVAAGVVTWFSFQPLSPGERTYIVERGTTLRDLAHQFAQAGVVEWPEALVALAYLKNASHRIQAGEYRFASGITPADLLDQLVRGDVVSYPVTLIEGWTFRQILAALSAAPKLKATVSGLDGQAIMARLGAAGVHPEGRFYPDTYRYQGGSTDLDLLRSAYRRMAQVLKEEWADRAAGLPLETPQAALTLASIVEKETGLAQERGLIAGVFINRLRKGMRLQTDPTVIYGLGAGFNGNLRRRDLNTDTPYNTYTRAGLPPTPIAMPGRAALRASLHPATTQALYFVARGDGSHVFSNTLKEHNQAVIRYQLRGRARPFSSYPGNPR